MNLLFSNLRKYVRVGRWHTRDHKHKVKTGNRTRITKVRQTDFLEKNRLKKL